MTRSEALTKMSALGDKQTFAVSQAMSALPPIADMCSALDDVCFGPKADSCTAANWDSLLDHLVGEAEQFGWHFNAERLGGFGIDGHVKFCRLYNRQVRGLLTFQNASR